MVLQVKKNSTEYQENQLAMCTIALLLPDSVQSSMLCWKYDSPWYTAQVPGLQLVNDLRFQHHRLPGSYFLPQQVSHSSGELWLSLNDLRGLLVHYERAEGDISYMSERETFV